MTAHDLTRVLNVMPPEQEVYFCVDGRFYSVDVAYEARGGFVICAQAGTEVRGHENLHESVKGDSVIL